MKYGYVGPVADLHLLGKARPLPSGWMRTPDSASVGTPVFAVKAMMVRAWLDRECVSCGGAYDIEQRPARMAPSEPYVVTAGEKAYAVMDDQGAYSCPHCNHEVVDHAARVLGESSILGKSENKKVFLNLMVDPAWQGAGVLDSNGQSLGGSATDTAAEKRPLVSRKGQDDWLH